MRRIAPASLIILLSCGPFFYQAPPDIGQYPQRLAVKRWGQLFNETSPLDPALPSGQELDMLCQQLPEKLLPLDTVQRLAEIDRLLEENRSGAYSSFRANFLNEVRELAASPESFDAATAYLKWRTTPPAQISTPPAFRPWDMEEGTFTALHEKHREAIRQQLEDLNLQLNLSQPVMLPYWETRRGAVLFERRKYLEAADVLKEVVEKYPGNPRSEAALILQARCLIEESRELLRLSYDQPQPAGDADSRAADIEVLRGDASNLLTGYLERFPKGRFLPDAHGWLGAIAFDRNEYGAATRHQLDRLSAQPTREITRTVLRECDLIFTKQLAAATGEDDPWLDPKRNFDASAVARHPLVTRLFLQHALDPAGTLTLEDFRYLAGDNTEGDRRLIRNFGGRIFLPKKLAQVALRALEREVLNQTSADDPLVLHLLSWSASEAGEHEQALALLKRIPTEASSNDEAMYAKGIILQRADHHAEAAEIFLDLAERFPKSPLLVDQPYRLALSLARSGKAGEAVLPLVRDIPHPESSGEQMLRSSLELTQWMDTLLQFAPLEELEAPLAAMQADDRRGTLLRNAVRLRAIAAEDFDKARKYLGGQSPEFLGGEWYYMSDATRSALTMDEAGWQEKLAPLVELHEKLRQAQPADQPAIHLEIARHWMKHRGVLTLPMNRIIYYANSEEEKQDLLRRRNAQQLGYPLEQVNAILDGQDETSHALKYALKAAETSSPAIAAQALELANQCLFRRAEYSLYQRSRALETDATALSHKIHKRLTEAFPASPEAKRPVPLTFRPATGPWMPGDYNFHNAADAILSAVSGQPARGWYLADDEDGIARKRIAGLPAQFLNPDPKLTLVELRARLKTAQQEFTRLHSSIISTDQGEVIDILNRLDDLSAAASLDGITMEDFIGYANERRPLPPAFDSLLDYRKRLTLNYNGNEPSNDTIGGWQEFLRTYPGSPKAEAASFRLTRLMARNYRGRVEVEAFQFPDAPIPGGYKRIEVTRSSPVNDAQPVLAAIHDHELRFPAGRYQADLNLLRAGALIDLENYGEALKLLGAILADKGQGDLHALAALNFCDIAQRLLEPETRAKPLAAFRADPQALAILRRLIKGDTFLSRLEPFDL